MPFSSLRHEREETSTAGADICFWRELLGKIPEGTGRLPRGSIRARIRKTVEQSSTKMASTFFEYSTFSMLRRVPCGQNVGNGALRIAMDLLHVGHLHHKEPKVGTFLRIRAPW